MENTVGVVSVVKRELVESDALSDGSIDAIYLEDQIISRFGKATDHPGWRGLHVEVLGFRNSKGGGCLGG